MTFFSGIVNSNEHVRLGGYPASFRKLLGMWVEEFAAYGETDVFHVETEDGKQFACDFWSELIHLKGAESLAQYSDNYIAGYPAITRHAFGQGTCYYLGTSLEPAGLSWLVERICRETGVQKYTGIPAGVEITRRRDGSRVWLFLLNHSAEIVRVPLARLTSQKKAYDWITATELEGEIALEPAGVAVLQLNEA
jgi:beta-galactosidase